MADPVDPRLVRVILRALRSCDRRDDAETARRVADVVWAWLAEGDR